MTIPNDRGLAGHSDADVLIHAIIDALLGAAALGNIGGHFPETPEFRGASGLDLLRRTSKLLTEQGWQVVNVDSTIVAEKPRLSAYLGGMQHALSAALGVSPERISVKPKSANGLGFAGKGEGMEAHAVALIEKK